MKTSILTTAAALPTAPERYRVQFTIGQDAHATLRRTDRASPTGTSGPELPPSP